jgi:hypothetical protein
MHAQPLRAGAPRPPETRGAPPLPLLQETALMSVRLALASFVLLFAGRANAYVEFDQFALCNAPGASDDAASIVQRLVDAMPPNWSDGSLRNDRYLAPTDAQALDLARGVRHLVQGIRRKYTTGITLIELYLGRAGYAVCRAPLSASSSEVVLVVHQPAAFNSATTRGGSVMLLRHVPGELGYPHPSEKVILSVPHPVADRRTHQQALSWFALKPTRIRAAIFAAVHRCNARELGFDEFQDDDFDGCENHPTSDGYKRSDAAHNDDAFFQVMHEEMRMQNWFDVFVQLHGMEDAGMSVSRGTQDGIAGRPFEEGQIANTTKLARFHNRLRQLLAEAFANAAGGSDDAADRDNVTSCLRYPALPGQAVPRVVTRNCATLNANIRRDPRIDQLPTDRNGFLHLEQSGNLRDNHAALGAGAIDVIVGEN